MAAAWGRRNYKIGSCDYKAVTILAALGWDCLVPIGTRLAGKPIVRKQLVDKWDCVGRRVGGRVVRMISCCSWRGCCELLF